MWKRFETAPKDHDEKDGEGLAGSGEHATVLGDATNTSRSVKRMRVKGEGDSVTAEGKENKPARYLATLRDKAQGTPRSELLLARGALLMSKD